MKPLPSNLSVWHDEYTIRSYEVASSGYATMELVCNLMQESAGRHATALGFGVPRMLEQGRIWALSRLAVEVRRFPKAAEPVYAETWPKGVNRLFALRDFLLSDGRGETLASLTGSWLIVNTETRALVRPAGLFDEIPIENGKHAIEKPAVKLPDPAHPTEIARIRVRPGDLDMQNHVNNARYIAWIEGAVGQAMPTRGTIRRLEVNFVSEGFLGDELCVEVEETEDSGLLIKVSRGSDGGTVAKARAHCGDHRAEEGDGSAPKAERPAIHLATIAAAEKIAGVAYTEMERRQMLGRIANLALSADNRRNTRLGADISPALGFRPLAAAPSLAPSEGRSETAAAPLPATETDIAYAPVRLLSEWVRTGAITSRRLTELYLHRLEKYGEALSCTVTLTKELALAQADAADAEITSGHYRGPLHGIPWGAKDLLDTAGIPTTWGAQPYKDRVPATDAAVVRMLGQAGAVLVAKLTLGALANGDIWFGGRTNNPWKPSQGSSGSSAGSAAATAAGLVGFAIGSETMGSIVGPSLRCGVAGLRPTFGRVPRTGAMTLSWSYDKIGPICRSVGDTGLVLEAIAGADSGDPDSVDLRFQADPAPPIAGMRIGYSPSWFLGKDETETGLFESALESVRQTCRREKMTLTETMLPERPYRSLHNLISVDAAAAFEELTLSDRDDELTRQADEAWPNSFRLARFVSAVDYVQLQRLRRLVMQDMFSLFKTVDILVSPEETSPLSVITNSTGQPSLTLPAGFREDGTPFGVTLWGAAYDEARLCAVGSAMESVFGVSGRRPTDFV